MPVDRVGGAAGGDESGAIQPSADGSPGKFVKHGEQHAHDAQHQIRGAVRRRAWLPLVHDALDAPGSTGENSPAYLMLDGVHAEMAATDEGATVTIVLPKVTALELGLLSPDASIQRTP